jgi:hypothetical protein
VGVKWNLTRGFRCRNSSLELCGAQSAGISLLEEENGQPIFRWYGVAGEYAPHLWGTTPREFSPCGTVLDSLPVLSERNAHQPSSRRPHALDIAPGESRRHEVMASGLKRAHQHFAGADLFRFRTLQKPHSHQCRDRIVGCPQPRPGDPRTPLRGPRLNWSKRETMRAQIARSTRSQQRHPGADWRRRP